MVRAIREAGARTDNSCGIHGIMKTNMKAIAVFLDRTRNPEEPLIAK